MPASLPFAPISAQAGILANHEATLASYGTFFEHQKYGKVWMPAANVVPQGWHPYPPCHWVNTKYGWYFQDNTPWGAIVHHHGRWAHEPKVGWMWIPGEEFSPGWVIWKTSEQWVGWAPTPPDQDMKTLDADEFNTDKMWTFMDAKKFGKSCAGDAVVVSFAGARHPGADQIHHGVRLCRRHPGVRVPALDGRTDRQHQYRH